jgi:hypothetical protein
MPTIEDSPHRTSSAGSTLAGVVVLALIGFAGLKGLHSYGRSIEDRGIKQHEAAVRASPETDESTVVLVG